MYYLSPKLCKEFHNSAGILDEEVTQFACLKKVQWLTSRHQALKVITINYKTLHYKLSQLISHVEGRQGSSRYGESKYQYLRWIKTGISLIQEKQFIFLQTSQVYDPNEVNGNKSVL